MEKKCVICNSNFNVKPSQYEKRKTCSNKCAGLNKTKNETVICYCFVCKKELRKRKSTFKKSSSGNVFCSNECVGKYNASQRVQNIKKECVICGERFKTIKARESTHITCSNKCQGAWQSQYRIGENSSNYRGGGGEKICLKCENTFKTESPSLLEIRKFCSIYCKQKYWIENTLHNESFKIAHFNGNQEYRENRVGETAPEKMVREYLESLGLIKDVDFFQEKGFFRKYYADFFIPKTKTIIEVNGDFWHGNPLIYGEGLKPLYDSQIDRIEKDKMKKADFIKYGFNYYIIWENDIYIESEMKKVKIQ